MRGSGWLVSLCFRRGITILRRSIAKVLWCARPNYCCPDAVVSLRTQMKLVTPRVYFSKGMESTLIELPLKVLLAAEMMEPQ